MKQAFNQRYLISYISKLLYVQWFFGLGGRELHQFPAYWRGALFKFTQSRKRKFVVKPNYIIISRIFQYLSAFLVRTNCNTALKICPLRKRWINRLRLVGESFSPSVQFQKWEIHTVFLHFQNFRLSQNLLPPALDDLISASLKIRPGVAFMQLSCQRGGFVGLSMMCYTLGKE